MAANMGLVPARGPWEYRYCTTASAATFLKGAVLSLNPARTLREYASTHSSAFGIAMHDSTNSLPPGKVLVAIPAPGCTAYGDIETNVAASALSRGQTGVLAKSGNYSVVSTTGLANSSAFSQLVRIASEQPDFSRYSRVEVSFILDNWTEYGSASTSTYAS